MAVKQTEGSLIPDDFGYGKHPELRKWIESEYPKLDPEKTMTRFIEWADDCGRLAAKWTACFKRVIRAGVDNGYKGICMYKNGKYDDPKWSAVLALAHNVGFREPLDHEQPGSYRTELEQWQRTQKRSTVTPFSLPADAMKKFGT